MRIVTYNILLLEGWPHEKAVDVMGEPGTEQNYTFFTQLFEQFDAEIIALQEVSTVEQMKELAKRLQRYLAPFPSPTRYAGCVLSQYPVLETRTFNDVGPRGREGLFSRFGGATLLDLGQEKLWVVNIHLNPHEIEIRNAEADLLAKHVDALLKVEENVVVVGDYNSVMGEAVHQRLQERGFANAMQEFGGGIVPTDGLGRVAIDHVYVSPQLKGRVTKAQVLSSHGFKKPEPDSWAYSDHLPVVVDFE